MAVKHLKPYTEKELRKKNPDIPIWKRREAWISPLAVLLVIGYAIFGIGYAILWVLRLLLLSWMRPFTDAKWLCKLGLHKWRFLNKNHEYTYHYCKACHQGLENRGDYASAGIPYPENGPVEPEEDIYAAFRRIMGTL